MEKDLKRKLYEWADSVCVNRDKTKSFDTLVVPLLVKAIVSDDVFETSEVYLKSLVFSIDKLTDIYKGDNAQTRIAMMVIGDDHDGLEVEHLLFRSEFKRGREAIDKAYSMLLNHEYFKGIRYEVLEELSALEKRRDNRTRKMSLGGR